MLNNRSFSKKTQWGYCLLWLLNISLPCSAQPVPEKTATESSIMEHIADAHSWHFATIDTYRITLHLPIILCSRDKGIECFSSKRFYDPQHNPVSFRGYRLIDNKIYCLDPHRSIIDISITKNVAAMWLSMVLLVTALLVVARRYRQTALETPRGVMAFIDLMVTFVKNEIVIPNIGKRCYKRFLPYLLTIFCFIWLNNLLGLLPGGANVTGNISVTLVLAAFTILLMLMNGNRHYWSHIFKPAAVPKWLWPIMIPIEIVGIFTRFFSLMIRLFANITAGHIILLSIIDLIFNMQSLYIGFAISLPFGTFMFLLKLLVAVLQAYVFTLLSAIYLGQAVGEEGGGAG